MNILLVSEDFIKSNSAINDNLFGKYLLPAIKDAQLMGLTKVVGECIYNTLIALVSDGSIKNPENSIYKQLLDDYIQDYLLYKVQANLVPVINIKMANIGSVIAKDEYVETLSQKDIDLVINYFNERSDFYAKRCQKFIKNNSKELKGCENSCLEGPTTVLTTSLFLD